MSWLILRGWQGTGTCQPKMGYNKSWSHVASFYCLSERNQVAARTCSLATKGTQEGRIGRSNLFACYQRDARRSNCSSSRRCHRSAHRGSTLITVYNAVHDKKSFRCLTYSFLCFKYDSACSAPSVIQSSLFEDLAS